MIPAIVTIIVIGLNQVIMDTLYEDAEKEQ
jgi:hypothetical protein